MKETPFGASLLVTLPDLFLGGRPRPIPPLQSGQNNILTATSEGKGIGALPRTPG